MWKSGTKVEWQEENKAQNACKQLVVINLSGANRVFCRTDLILLIPCSCLCWMSLLNTLLISSLVLFWITHPDLQDLLISLGPRPKHNKKHLVWSGDLDRLLSKQGTAQARCGTFHRYHCRGHHSTAWDTASEPLCLHHRGKSTQKCRNTPVCSIMWWWSPQVQINIAKSKVFQLITFIIQIQILSNLTC